MVSELEKRIATKANEHCKHIDNLAPEINKMIEQIGDKQTTIHINTEDMALKMWDAIRIIREAKKEFPSCEVCPKSMLPEPALTCYDARHKYPSECPKDEWFERWFGDKE